MVTAGNRHSVQVQEGQRPQPLEQIKATVQTPGGNQAQRGQREADKNRRIDPDQGWFWSVASHREVNPWLVTNAAILAAAPAKVFS
jgi:hypothetical protein